MKVALITAIYGPYEASCKPVAQQTIEVDKICFSNVENLKLNGWNVDRTPYHETFPSELDSRQDLRNSFVNNKHTYNTAKYYKFQWHLIPALKDYDFIIWVDGTVEITEKKAVEMLIQRAEEYEVCTWNHERHSGILEREVRACSRDKRFCTTHWFGQDQPLQPVSEQYSDYVKNGYSNEFWKEYPRREGRGDGRNFGVWFTCMITSKYSPTTIRFNNAIYYELKKWSTMEQICLPKVAQDLNFVPYTLPDKEITGSKPHYTSSIHIKHRHGN